jgi:hypothetical protein
VLLKSRMRESLTYGSVRGTQHPRWCGVYSTSVTLPSLFSCDNAVINGGQTKKVHAATRRREGFFVLSGSGRKPLHNWLQRRNCPRSPCKSKADLLLACRPYTYANTQDGFSSPLFSASLLSPCMIRPLCTRAAASSPGTSELARPSAL